MKVKINRGEHKSKIGTVQEVDKTRNLYGLTFPFDHDKDEVKYIYWIHQEYVTPLDNQYRKVETPDG